MNTKLFSEAMSEVNDKYYEEAANYHCKKHGWVKFTSLAACAAIVLAVSFATLWKLPSQTTPQPEYEPPIITNPDNQSDNPEQGISLNLNEIKELNATSGSIALMADDYTAYFEVKDTGIGIPKEHQTRVFERFYRVDKSRSKSTGGTGLGLAIVKHIVVQLHGTLSLKSEPQVGTQIRIELPKSLS